MDKILKKKPELKKNNLQKKIKSCLKAYKKNKVGGKIATELGLIIGHKISSKMWVPWFINYRLLGPKQS